MRPPTLAYLCLGNCAVFIALLIADWLLERAHMKDGKSLWTMLPPLLFFSFAGTWVLALEVVITALLCLSAWVAHERCCLRREQQATEILERDYNAHVLGRPYNMEVHEYEQRIDLRELLCGRLYVPVDGVAFHGTTVDRRALEQLACFRYLDSLSLEECRLESAAEFRPAGLSELKRLNFYRTLITNRQLRSISRLRRLEGLTFDATGLTGDCLRWISDLPALTELQVHDGDLSDGAADSLARMKGLTWLYLCNCKIDTKLGPALGRLETLEFLAISDEPFDDEGVKHLTSLKCLSDLSLDRTAVTDGGMASVAELTNLTHLDLGDTKVGDAGLRHLSKLPKLAVLRIGGTRATNSCLPTLAAMPSLKFACVSGTDIKPSAVGFVGVLHDGQWYRDEAKAKAVEGFSGDEKESHK